MAAAGVLARIGAQPQAQQPAAQEGEKKLIDLKSDLTGPVAPGDSVIFLVGNFAAQHNGAVITCDSAVRYSDMRIEFFGNVLINKNTTYIYGDRAVYDGEVNEAEVFSDLVKVVDGDATLYTYKFLYNTKDNIGEFADGGVMINRDNLLEAVRGFYYGDTKELICVERVEMRNDEYELTGDSVIYNMASDNAYFFERTNIWNNGGDYLYADRGEYRKADSLYIVTRNGYVLTEKQEMWSDSIDYFRPRNHVILRNDLQLDDTEHKVLAFGDYGEYWKEPGNAFLTRRPSVVSYDLSQGSDSLFMRADSMFLYTILPGQTPDSLPAPGIGMPDSLSRHAPAAADSLSLRRPIGGPGRAEGADSLGRDMLSSDSLRSDSLRRSAPADSLSIFADTVQLTDAERAARLREQARKEKEEKKIAAAKVKKERLDRIAAERREKNRAKFDAQKQREEEREAIRRAKALTRLKARQARAARKGKPIPIDSVLMGLTDSLARATAAADSLAAATDSLAADSLSAALSADSLDSLTNPADTMYRLLKGYRNVKIYRSDFQSVCDSMTAISTDSTIHLYIDPVLWSQSNQITSDVMDIYTRNQQIVRAEFVGSPMMVAQLDTTHYNQISGKQMTAFFRDNEIYRNDVNGNAQTIYYMQDGEPPEITMMGVIQSGDASFYIEKKEVIFIVYRAEPVYNFYPMDQIPATQELYLKGFKWEGVRRPSLADVFDRRIRPSVRREKSRLRHPDFPIMQRVEAYKQQLTEQRRWTDRNDQVDQPTVEWMRDLGYEVGQPRQ